MRPNRITMIIRHFVAVLSAIYVASNLTGCSRSTKPKEVRYNLYVGATHIYTSPEDSSFNRIYIYDADSLTLLDSIWQAYSTEFLDVSPDGRWLYVTGLTSLWSPRAVAKIDTRTKQTVWSPSDLWGVRCIANGTLLLAGREVLKADDGTIVRHLTDSLYPFWGPVSGTKIAAIGHITDSANGNPPVVRVIDVSTGEVSGGYTPRLSSGIGLQALYTARLHPDGRRVLAIGVYGSVHNSWFVVGDVVTGQTLFEYQIDFPHGEITISHDGKTAVFTDPAAYDGGKPYVVDLQTYTARSTSSEFGAARACFFEGDERILIAPWSGPIQVMNLTSLAVERVIWPTGHDPLNLQPIGGIAIGPRP